MSKNTSANMLQKKLHPFIYLTRLIVGLATIATLFVLVGLISYILINGLPGVTWKFLTTAPSFLEQTYGILPMIINTAYLVVLSLLICIPIGVGAALYLSEYAKQGKIVGSIRFAIEILSGIPSIVYGLFGALFFVKFMGFGYSLLAGACTLSIIVLPVIIRTTEESIKSVDVSYREAAMSLGVNRLHIIKTILLPCAIPGILTAVILSIGRMVGESAALLATSGTAYNMPNSVLSHINDSGATLTVQLYQCFTERPPGMTANTPLAIAAVLMILVFVLNMSATAIASAFRKKV